MIIDKNGSLFGKINILDLVIVVVVIAAIAFGVSQAGVKKIIPTFEQKSYTVTYYLEDASEFVAKQVTKGDKMIDEYRNADLGTITSVSLAPSQTYANTVDGKNVLSPRPGLAAVTITAQTTAETFDHGIVMGGNKYSIGHYFVAYAGKAKMFLHITDIRAN